MAQNGLKMAHSSIYLYGLGRDDNNHPPLRTDRPVIQLRFNSPQTMAIPSKTSIASVITK